MVVWTQDRAGEVLNASKKISWYETVGLIAASKWFEENCYVTLGVIGPLDA